MISTWNDERARLGTALVILQLSQITALFCATKPLELETRADLDMMISCGSTPVLGRLVAQGKL
jgi:hypothetical protein